MEWVNAHADGCPVAVWRARLLADLEGDPGNPYLTGALPEYDCGGDQEVEICDCRSHGHIAFVPRASGGTWEYWSRDGEIWRTVAS